MSGKSDNAITPMEDHHDANAWLREFGEVRKP